jgi:hypothetical protein
VLHVLVVYFLTTSTIDIEEAESDNSVSPSISTDSFVEQWLLPENMSIYFGHYFH